MILSKAYGRQSYYIIRLEADSNCRKTEILLETAFRLRNVSNIFFIQARDTESLERTLLDIATSIGHDLLSIRFPHSDLAGLWRSYGPSERIRAFKTWLAHPSNQASLFIVDDLDGYKDETLIKDALPREAQVILYSTRDPSLIGSLDRDSKSYYISTMQQDEMASLMVTMIRRSGGIFSRAAILEKDLEAIAKVVDGHALGACRAIGYILHVLAQTTESPAADFLDMFNGPEWESRLQFLEYKPRIGLSIMETFAVSLERIRRHQSEAARLLDLLAFLSGKEQSLNFRDFLRLERPWLEEMQILLPDYEVFAMGLKGQGEYLAELENVSIGVRPDVSVPLQIHPLWLECIQQRAGHEGRVRWIRQIIILVHGSYARGEEEDYISLRPFLQNAFAIAARFRIGPEELLEYKGLRDWVDTLNEHPENFSDGQSSDGGDSESSDETDMAESVESDAPNADTSGKTLQLYQDMVSLRDSCNEAVQALASTNVSKMSETAFTSWRQRYLALLRRLQSLTENEQDSRTVVTLHLEIYDLLIGMAPVFECFNPRLSELLRGRREEVRRRNNLA